MRMMPTYDTEDEDEGKYKEQLKAHTRQKASNAVDGHLAQRRSPVEGVAK